MKLSRDLEMVFLKPGEIVVTGEPLRVTTLLGSCVAVTMYVPRLRLGGICHALLPKCRNEHSDCCGEAGKYVRCAIEVMLEELTLHGVLSGEIEGKLFGGSDMFDTVDGRRQSVGCQNIEMARQMLEENGVRVATQDLGGPRGRKIIFNTNTGEVFLKRLRKTEV
ncbi:putative chemoreceptor glutamine deamidase CheD 2 [Geomonas silvestris]|uniref:Probable chemoreceptor glutamine deamidase CheD n=1 Tax=Geomonas silvestris TaxID=2740184 RepID=A0A6V8MHC0_9BACT|nr:chemotaxis protein CheD [Geomonas silvestris]GFO59357.1 putative chemoreceptor glutamine deamidase CheD 2 [Geomonas silvestris]